MNVPSINIQSVHGKIGLQSNRPHIQIQQQAADLTINQEHQTLNITKQPSKLTIDQTEAFHAANLKHIYRLNEEFSAKAMNHAAEVTMKYASEGDQLMRIENGGNIVSRLAERNAVLYPDREVNIKQMPPPFSVKTNYQPSEIKLQVSSSEPEIKVNRRDPTISIPKWQTDAYIKQKNQITMQAVGLQVNQQK